VLLAESSAELLERLLSELARQEGSNELIAWAKASLPLKNTLLEADARTLEDAYQQKREGLALPDLDDEDRSSVARRDSSGDI
jgi:hypothetical protein